MPYCRNHLLILFLLLISACYNPDTDRKLSDENLYGTTPDDKEMNQAIATARRNFHRFESAYESGRYDPLKFTIKVRFADPAGNEYIWLTDVAKVGDHYSGVVSDTPRQPPLPRRPRQSRSRVSF